MKATETSTRLTVAGAWGEQDERFFRLVRHLFPAQFLFGAGVLLAANGDD